jgi:hypothetical protein
MRYTALLLLAALAAPSAAFGQKGTGTTGASILQLPAGSRAPALSGAYVGVSGDADALFYNPAGIAGISAAASLSYQRHVEDIGLFSGAGAFRAGPVVLAASLLMLDYGEIDEVVPDPDFGGQTGRKTGVRVGASEMAARVATGLSTMQDRLRMGVSIGIVTSELAGASRSTPTVDAGLQYGFSRVTLGAALRNLGYGLSGHGLADAPLPSELRLGAAVDLGGTGRMGALVAADYVFELEERTSGVVAGIEAGLLPGGPSRLGAVARVGYNGGTGEEGLGLLQLGGGLSYSRFSLDYTYQHYDFFGAIHRFGVRWAR